MTLYVVSQGHLRETIRSGDRVPAPQRPYLATTLVKHSTEIKTLQETLPICANCKKIRNEQGAWQQLELYISQHTDTEFNHGLCADCRATLYTTL